MTAEVTIIRAPRLFGAEGTVHDHGASLWIEGDSIIGVYGSEAPAVPGNARVLDFPDGCILPGLIDSHTHLMYGTGERMSGPRSYDHVNDEDSDGLMLLRSVRNAYQHLLKAGVTSMRDLGARNRITFDLKDGASADLFKGFPTLHVCGRAVTITGGHFHFGHEEADGEAECRKSVRRLVKEGADFIKIIGFGGRYLHHRQPAGLLHDSGTARHCRRVPSSRQAVHRACDCDRIHCQRGGSRDRLHRAL